MGTASQGYTLEEAVANLREATTELYLEEEPAAVQRTGEVTATLFEADVLTAEKQNLETFGGRRDLRNIALLPAYACRRARMPPPAAGGSEATLPAIRRGAPRAAYRGKSHGGEPIIVASYTFDPFARHKFYHDVNQSW